jgi:SAM-dependent methyltransferase
MSSRHSTEVEAGRRFEFGANWARFLEELDLGRVERAERSLSEMLRQVNLVGKRFLDVGSGSGLFSLAARRLGATVHSFDYDPTSVACTNELKRRFYPDDSQWTVAQGSILDNQYLASLGRWDIVYSWGVLHHTGHLWQAVGNVANLADDGGVVFIALYNDQGRASARWLAVKKAYNRLPPGLRWLILAPATIRLWGPVTVRDLVTGRPFRTWRNYSKASPRGMAPWRDVVDWVGGLPFEVATPEQVFRQFRDRGFRLDELATCAGGHGCNEFVFRRE